MDNGEQVIDTPARRSVSTQADAGQPGSQDGRYLSYALGSTAAVAAAGGAAVGAAAGLPPFRAFLRPDGGRLRNKLMSLNSLWNPHYFAKTCSTPRWAPRRLRSAQRTDLLRALRCREAVRQLDLGTLDLQQVRVQAVRDAQHHHRRAGVCV